MLSYVQLFVTLWAVDHQAPLSMEFSRQEYWSGLPCPTPKYLPNPGIKPGSPALQADSLSLSYQGSPYSYISQFSCSLLSNSVTPWTAARQVSLSITNSWSLLKLMSIKSVMPFNHLILCCPLLLLLSIFPASGSFSNESVLRIRWPEYWSFSFSIIPSKEVPGLISFRMDWLDLLAVQGTLKSLLQDHSSKASILQHSAFFMVQLSHPYMTTRKTRALTRWESNVSAF